jgi:uncharacterized protein (UPF0261 family)
MLPLKGVSMIDAPDQAFYGPNEDLALFETLRAKIDQSISRLEELPLHINEQKFAELAAQNLIDLMNKKSNY